MVGAFRHVVFLGRVQPDGSHAEIFQVIQMVFNTLQVTTMAAVLLVSVNFVFEHTRYDVVVRITIGKSVGHNKVKYIACIETFHFR